MATIEYLKHFKEEALQAIQQIKEEEIAFIIEVLDKCRREQKQIFLIGNGGSAATATHFANDLGKGASALQPRFRVLSLTDNVAWITALANDLDYSQIFVEQLKNYAQPGDVVVAFSGSGNSPNIVAAVDWAKKNKCVTIGVTGRPGGKLAHTAKTVIHIESPHMAHIEEGHFIVQHLIGYYFMENRL
ncbi:MAG TPA: SIS domain-containing protein [Acidobacteriota bacterium]|jgi:D-sedoheptulose 7-phosphate isomerase|nr:SIS domain-containing protein [Acidobacteriota bacterium]